MRLINVETFQLTEFFDAAIPKYAILSHRWLPSSQEVTFHDVEEGILQTADSIQKKQGLAKIKGTCLLAREYGLRYAWIDACCIDKSSSTELSEAINSMFRWYQNAAICFAYLADVDLSLPEQHPFEKSQWFKRGWTLQELVAPRNVIFYDYIWELIGSKRDLQYDICRITNIDTKTLTSGEFSHVPLGRRMSWASSRRTSRIEDQAYSLLGLFNVNMPLLYGEGPNAFLRLQKKILKTSNDPSMFEWKFQTESECKAKLEEFRTVEDWEPKKKDFLASSLVDFLPQSSRVGSPDEDMRFPLHVTLLSDQYSDGDNHFRDAAVMVADLVCESNDLYYAREHVLRPDSHETAGRTASIIRNNLRQPLLDDHEFPVEFAKYGLNRWFRSRGEEPVTRNDGPINFLRAWSLFLTHKIPPNRRFPYLRPVDTYFHLGNPFEENILDMEFLRVWSVFIHKNPFDEYKVHGKPLEGWSLHRDPDGKDFCPESPFRIKTNDIKILDFLETNGIVLRDIQERLMKLNGLELPMFRFQLALSFLDWRGCSKISDLRNSYKVLIRPTVQLIEQYAQGLKKTADDYHGSQLACFMGEYARPLASLLLLRTSSLVGADATTGTWLELVSRTKGDAEAAAYSSSSSPKSTVSPFIPSTHFLLSNGIHACFMRRLRRLIRPRFRSNAIHTMESILATRFKHHTKSHLFSHLLDLELDGDVRLEIHENENFTWRRHALNIIEDLVTPLNTLGWPLRTRERVVAKGAIKLSWTSPRLGIRKVAHMPRDIGKSVFKAHQQFYRRSYREILPLEEPDATQEHPIEEASQNPKYLFVMIPLTRGSRDVSVAQLNTEHPNFLKMFQEVVDSQYRETRGRWWKLFSLYRPSYIQIGMAQSDGLQFRLCDDPVVISTQDPRYLGPLEAIFTKIRILTEQRIHSSAFSWDKMADPMAPRKCLFFPQRYYALDTSGLFEDKIWCVIVRERFNNDIIHSALCCMLAIALFAFLVFIPRIYLELILWIRWNPQETFWGFVGFTFALSKLFFAFKNSLDRHRNLKKKRQAISSLLYGGSI